MNPPSPRRQFHIVPTDTTLTYRFNRSNSTETLLILTAQKTGVFRQFRRILVCFGGKLVSGWYKMNEFFFFPSIFGTYISLSLECWMTMIVQISACRIIPHFFFLLSTDQTVQVNYPFSFCFHFSEQLPIFSTSLKDSPILF